MNESKKEVALLVPAALQPRTLFFSEGADAKEVVLQLLRHNLTFPVIAKPDIGGRGRGVKLLRDSLEVEEYVQKSQLDFQVQEFISYPHEVGIFYYRYPGQLNGQLSGIVRKEFLKVKGDGSRTVEALLKQNDRGILQLPDLMKNQPALLRRVPSLGEELVVVPYGNHARGATFLDDSTLICEPLRATIDRLCQQIPDFYFGRLDIKYRDWEELKNGQHFSVIEVNGAGSEPTHMYDPRHSIFFAWKEIIRHWIILFRVSRLNHRRGFPYLTWNQGMGMLRENKLVARRLSNM